MHSLILSSVWNTGLHELSSFSLTMFIRKVLNNKKKNRRSLSRVAGRRALGVVNYIKLNSLHSLFHDQLNIQRDYEISNSITRISFPGRVQRKWTSRLPVTAELFDSSGPSSICLLLARHGFLAIALKSIENSRIHISAGLMKTVQSLRNQRRKECSTLLNAIAKFLNTIR